MLAKNWQPSNLKGLSGENLKKGTPSMGGIIIILAILIPGKKTLSHADYRQGMVGCALFITPFFRGI